MPSPARGSWLVWPECSSPASPQVRGAPTATSSPPAPGAECVVDRPRQGRRRRRRRRRPRAPAQAGRGAAHPRAHRPHVVGRPGRRRRTTPRPTSTRATATCSPTRWPASRRETAAMLLGGATSSPSPTTSRELGRRCRRSSSPGCSSSSTTPRATPRARSPSARRTTTADGRLRGDVLRRPAVRRLDRAHRPARRRPRRRCCAAWPTRCCRCADDIVVLPGHGEQTTIGRERATNPFLLDLHRRRRPSSAPEDSDP